MSTLGTKGTLEETDYRGLNAELNLLDENGKLQFHKDKEAVRQYFLTNVNRNTVFFHSLREKLDYLVDYGYYDEDIIELYSFKFVKSMFKKAYSYRFRFETFLGAYKFYTSYALKTFDGKRFLERFEDRVTMTALYLAQGDEELAVNILNRIMRGEYQPATPTFLNAGKAQRGELVSCFKGDTNVTTLGGVPKKISEIEVGDLVLTHKGRYKPVEKVIVNRSDDGFNMVELKAAGVPKIIETDNHPVLVWNENPNDKRTFDPKLNEFIPDFKPNDNGHWLWVAAANVIPFEDWVFLPKDNSLDTSLEAESEGDSEFSFNSEYGVFKKVVSLESAPSETEVYNLVVEQDHTYVTEGVVQKNCFLLRVEDNMESIHRAIGSSLQLSKRGGGVALNLTNLRELGAPIKQLEGQASGVIPVMKILEDSFSYANQLGARQGAGAVYLHAHHPDIMRFLDTKRENADEKIRIKTLSLGVVVPDITFTLAKENADMYLFSPYDIEREYGVPMSDLDITKEYYNLVDNPKITKKKIKAREFFQTIAEIQFESGYPYILFVDTANRGNPIHGTINMSNLCVTGDTRFNTTAGYKTAKELFDSQDEFKVIVDNRARLMNLDFEGQVSTVSSTKMHLTAKKSMVYKIETNEGYSLKATAWHKMYVNRDGELVKIPLSEVKVGDKLLVQSGENSDFGSVDLPDLAYLAGVIAADGVFKRNNKSLVTKICLYGKKKKLSKTIEDPVSKALHGREDLILRQSTLNPKFTDASASGQDKSRLQCAPLGKLLKEHGMEPENKLVVPDFVLNGNRETRRRYLSGVVQFDGWVGKAGTAPSVQIGSISREFLEGLQLLFSSFGIFSAIYSGRKEETTALLPDGKGDKKEYVVKPTWRLYVNGKEGFSKACELLDLAPWQQEKYEKIVADGGLNDRVYTLHKYAATVSSVELSGVEDVYDVTVEDGHSIIVNGVVTGNCSEVLEINSPSEYNPDSSYSHVGRDISCNLGSINIAKAFDSDDFENLIETSMRALSAVSDLSNLDVVPSIVNGNAKSHAVGLGAMNLHGFLAREGIYYDSPEAVEFTRFYFHAVNYYTLKASNKIAIEKGESFYEFEKSEYYTGEYFDKYLAKDWEIKLPAIKELFARSSIKIPTMEDWLQLKESIKEHGLYNAYRQAVAPTGSISYIANSTSCIHPVAAAIEVRKEGKIGRVVYPSPFLNNDNIHLYKDAYNVGPEAIIDVYAAATESVDQGLSLTLFFTDEHTTRDLNKAYLYAWKKGIKTIYYIRVRASALAGTELENTAAELCVSCSI